MLMVQAMQYFSPTAPAEDPIDFRQFCVFLSIVIPRLVAYFLLQYKGLYCKQLKKHCGRRNRGALQELYKIISFVCMFLPKLSETNSVGMAWRPDNHLVFFFFFRKMLIKTEISNETVHMRDTWEILETLWRTFCCPQHPQAWPPWCWSRSAGPVWGRLLRYRLADEVARSGSIWRPLGYQDLLHRPPSRCVKACAESGTFVPSTSFLEQHWALSYSKCILLTTRWSR